jgi:hypothetical protein
MLLRQCALSRRPDGRLGDLLELAGLLVVIASINVALLTEFTQTFGG